MFVIGATPDKVFGATSDFFNAKWQGVPQVTSNNPSRRTFAFDSAHFVEELMSANVDRTNEANSFSVNWKTTNSVTFATATALVRIPYYEQNFEIGPRCNGSTHSTGNWRTWLCVSGDSSKDAAMEWFEARHRSAVQNVFRELGVQGWLEEQINGEIPGCGAAATTTAPPSAASMSTSTSSNSSASSTTSPATVNSIPTTAPEPVPQAAPGQIIIAPEQKTAGGHKYKADVMYAFAIGGIIVSALLRLMER
ncbi:unnamed protein product [Tuber melanosporum]|uniref:(Perigord truffle) hypothetical protein n=1 Tax=Tuber melanosporum (strain Mel28) TaxID=656061 RepID=D5GDJ4_TUBMM|nr:uncharacterized protein GSTUM_00001049001 [Tuber melanosporum]CAZ82587.1 unnamed protein product [Tuber melanosporum]